jgi:hypothetical protein
MCEKCSPIFCKKEKLRLAMGLNSAKVFEKESNLKPAWGNNVQQCGGLAPGKFLSTNLGRRVRSVAIAGNYDAEPAKHLLVFREFACWLIR